LLFAPIVPVSYNPAQFTKYHLILAHQILQDKAYCNYYKNLGFGHTIIIDNSTIELGTPVDVLESATEFIGSESKIIIVAPDVLGSKDSTLDYCKEFFKRWNSLQEDRKRVRFWEQTQLMTVPQGKTREEWFSCLRELSKLGLFSYVGIPRVCEDMSGGRSGLFYGINTFLFREKYENNWKFHLLGIQHNIQEIGWAVHLSNSILGVDSSLPLRASFQNQNPLEVTDLRKLPDIDKYDNSLLTKVQTSIRYCVNYCASGKKSE
jgi:hypothetical protein